ncbi:helix-turn-helix transcriptional regulator [Crateriforma conspicua]|uniref:helix-turn-helix transcriptional regulator n=1 Tax=Crateriforma conspicua TaxID=2527996 RepID=UPI00118C16B8|nr:helix-turn-helix domain-containing protein [Crateriforma conspicua]QDV64462.1 MarR family protein [Crateriforma conspicua]
MTQQQPTQRQPATASEDLRSVDRELLSALRGGQSMTIGDLTDALGVTATAVRQRIDRLLSAGLIERQKEVAGRGRPTYRYGLTVLGHQRAGANPAELADAMWREIMAIEDAEVRDAVVAGVASRLGRQYLAKIRAIADDDDPVLSDLSLEERMKRLAGVLTGERIEMDVRTLASNDLPVLDITACPYPSLTEAASHDRAMCRLEEQMLSEALGKQVQLSSCRLDGDDRCQFSASPETSDSVDDAKPKQQER